MNENLNHDSQKLLSEFSAKLDALFSELSHDLNSSISNLRMVGDLINNSSDPKVKDNLYRNYDTIITTLESALSSGIQKFQKGKTALISELNDQLQGA